MSPERRYRLLLRCYPRSYRAERAEEMLDVLLATDGRRGSWAGLSEAASLVRHGLVLRLRLSFAGGRTAPSLGLAGASLVCLLAVLGAQQLLAAGLRGLGLDGYPDEWGLHVLWVDPRWPVHTVWVVTGLTLLLGRDRLAVVSAWTAAVLHAWHLVATAATGVDLPWPGDIGPHWTAPGGPAEATWFVLSLAGAVLLGGRARAARARTCLPRRRWWTVGAVGLVGAVVTALAAPAAYALTGEGALGLTDSIRGPVLPLALATVVLARGMLRAPHGRAALFLLGALAVAPLAVRWSTPMAVLGGAALLFAAGFAAASMRYVSADDAPG